MVSDEEIRRRLEFLRGKVIMMEYGSSVTSNSVVREVERICRLRGARVPQFKVVFRQAKRGSNGIPEYAILEDNPFFVPDASDGASKEDVIPDIPSGAPAVSVASAAPDASDEFSYMLTSVPVEPVKDTLLSLYDDVYSGPKLVSMEKLIHCINLGAVGTELKRAKKNRDRAREIYGNMRDSLGGKDSKRLKREFKEKLLQDAYARSGLRSDEFIQKFSRDEINSAKMLVHFLLDRVVDTEKERRFLKCIRMAVRVCLNYQELEKIEEQYVNPTKQRTLRIIHSAFPDYNIDLSNVVALKKLCALDPVKIAPFFFAPDFSYEKWKESEQSFAPISQPYIYEEPEEPEPEDRPLKRQRRKLFSPLEYSKC